MLKSINPYNNQIIEEFEEYSDDKLESLLKQSQEAFEEWKKTLHDHRKLLMKVAAGNLLKNISLYAGSITSEMGKPITESKAEIEKCALVCEYYAENAENFLRDQPIETEANMSYVTYEPIGSVLGIMPWNFPFWQVFRFAVPTLMAGNVVLLKHASNVQICARHIEKIFSSSGFLPGAFLNLVIGSEKVEKIIQNDAIKAVSLTGSENAGIKVAGAAGSNIKKSVLELGGSNAFIVLDDADIDKAVETGIKSRMSNAGQSCIAAKRFIVHQKVNDEFINLLLEKIKQLKYGDPSKDDTTIGPLANNQQAEILEQQVNKSVEMGARIIEGGHRSGNYYSPTVVTNVRPGMPLFDEEVFGPVAPITVAGGTVEAINLAKLTKFGLGITLFTNNLKKAKDLVVEFNDGAVFVNELVKSDPRLPFGGTKRSGFGRELSLHGIREFVNAKTVYIKKVT